MNIKIGYYLLLIASWIGYAHGQPMPSELWPVRNTSEGFDLGLNWEANTLLKPYNLRSVTGIDSYRTASLWIERDCRQFGKQWHNLQAPRFMIWPGFISQWKQGEAEIEGSDFRAVTLFSMLEFRNWYANIYVRASNSDDAFSNFTPHSRQISRAGMHAGEIDQALLGYINSWVQLSFGRGRQIWGPNLSNNLILSSSSASYDHLSLRLYYKRWSFSYFHGFLEAIKDSQGRQQTRFITGRALQYRPCRHGFIVVGETSVYYGENRSMDWGFMNPLIPHIENEQNQRENIINENQSNAIWFAAMDFLFPYQLRFSGSIVFDEFQLDRTDRNQGRPDAMAYQVRLAKSWMGTESALTLFGRYDAVGTYTYRHEKPFTCFASRELPLAMPQGSDFFQWTSGIRWIFPCRIRFKSEYSYRETGENNLNDLMYIPYTEFISVPFPSGHTIASKKLCFHVLWAFRSNFDIAAGYAAQWIKTGHQESNNHSLYLRMDIHLPIIILL